MGEGQSAPKLPNCCLSHVCPDTSGCRLDPSGLHPAAAWASGSYEVHDVTILQRLTVRSTTMVCTLPAWPDRRGRGGRAEGCPRWDHDGVGVWVCVCDGISSQSPS